MASEVSDVWCLGGAELSRNQAGVGVDNSFSLNPVCEIELVGSRMEPGRE